MTTTTILPTPWALLHTAISERRTVVVTYHGHARLVCPHALGWKAGKAMLLAYQTGGHTSTGKLPADPRQRWRCMHLDHIDNVTPPEHAQPWRSADNYNPAHPFPAIDEVVIAATSPHPAAR